MTDIILKTGEYYTPSEADLISWQRAYPNIDVHREIDSAACWCDEQPAYKRKIDGKRFVGNWLRRASQRAPMAKGGRTSTRNMTMTEMMDRSWAS